MKFQNHFRNIFSCFKSPIEEASTAALAQARIQASDGQNQEDVSWLDDALEKMKNRDKNKCMLMRNFKLHWRDCSIY